jgi:hypothetical protein
MANEQEVSTMRVLSRPSVGLIGCLVAAAILPACDKLASLSSHQEPAKDDLAQFEIRQDSRGRTIRINKFTGETAILEGNRFVPVKTAKEKTAVSDSPRRDAARPKPTSSAAGPATPPPAAPVAAAVPPESVAPPVVPMLATRDSMVTLTIAAPLFVLPDAHREPLRVGPAGLALRVLSVEGDWYRVEYTDPNWGSSHVGYVQTKYVRVEPRRRPE